MSLGVSLCALMERRDAGVKTPGAELWLCSSLAAWHTVTSFNLTESPSLHIKWYSLTLKDNIRFK